MPAPAVSFDRAEEEALRAVIAHLHAQGMNDTAILAALPAELPHFPTMPSASQVRDRRRAMGLEPRGKYCPAVPSVGVSAPAVPPVPAVGVPAVVTGPTPKDTDILPAPLVQGFSMPRFEIPEAPAPRVDNWARLEDDGKGYAIIGDIHSPTYNRETLLRWMEWSYRLNIRRFVIIGDVSNQDPYSKFGRNLQHPERLQEECESIGRLFQSFFQWFEEGEFIPGNHDIRMAKQMQNHFDSRWVLPRLYDAPEKLRFHEHGRIDIKSGDAEWVCIHGVNFSKVNPGKPVQDYAEMFQANVVSGHQHLNVDTRSRCGRFRCVCLGGAHDETRQGYKNYHPATFPKGLNSFGFLRDGSFKVVYPDTPEWG